MWDVIGIGELRRREECFTTLQIGHVLHHPKAKNGRAGVGFQIKTGNGRPSFMVRVNSISPKVTKLVLCMAKRYKLKILQVYAPTTSYLEENINGFYSDVDETLGNPIHYIIVMRDSNAQIGKRTNPRKRQRANLGTNF